MVLHTLPQSVERTEDLSLLCIMYKMKQLHLCEKGTYMYFKQI